ncbi:MAG: penicillin-binding protein 1A [Nitrospinales bacterium]
MKKILKACFVASIFITLLGFAAAGFIFFHFSKDLPDVRALKNYEPSTITKVYSDQDQPIAEFYIEKRILVPLEKIPPAMKQATLAVEDSNFYTHFGLDPKAIFRAMIANFLAGHIVEGGSTITQQLSKTLFLSRKKTLNRKIREAILAIRLEQIFSKDEILEMYLNQIYYGHGTYGVEAAARHYFAKHVYDLTVAECALLAGLPKAPNHYSPYRNPKQSKKRRDHALQRMVSDNYITQKQKEEAVKTEIILGKTADKLNRAPYFIEYIRQFLEDQFGSSKLYRAGLNVYTTLNLDYQLAAQKAIRENLRTADKRFGYRGSIGHINIDQPFLTLQQELDELNGFKEGQTFQEGDIVKGVVVTLRPAEVEVLLGREEGIIQLKDMRWARPPNVKIDGKWSKIAHPEQALALGDIVEVKILGPGEDSNWSLALEQEPEVEAGLVSLEAGTGHIKAMVGGYDFSKSQFNRALQAVRQPGSAFKPIIYTAAVNEGYTPASIIVDSPVIFKESELAFDKWKPVNFEEKFYGPTSLRTALVHSRNVVTIKLLQNIGVKKAVQMARAMGISSPLENNLSIALGSSGVTLFELTSAYAVLANMGNRIKPIAIRYIEDRNGNTLYTSEPQTVRALPEGVAFIITSLLKSVVQEGTGAKVKALHRPVAGKTGTTNNYVDAWFVGYTPQLVTGVWVGKDKDETLGLNETGSRTAIPIWLDFMKAAHEGVPVKSFPMSDEVMFSKIDPETGERANFNTPQARFEVFLRNKIEEPAPSDLAMSASENNF